ncbi:MAG: peroxiredoxin [Flavobacteriales bacterium]|jgi:peroxiredoxin
MKKLILLPTLFLATILFAQKGYKIGDVVEDFSLKNIDGEMLSMSDNSEAKGFIVTFTCNHCPYAVRYEDRLVDLDKKYAALGYPVLAINPNDVVRKPADSFEKMQVRAKEKGFTFPYLVDNTQDIARAFGATRTPHVFIVEKQKDEFILKYIGAIDDSPQDVAEVDEKFVENAVDSLLAGKDPKQNFTKAIGCTIKWKE